MKKIKLLIVVLGTIGLSHAAKAQKGTFKLDLNYNYSLPTGGFKSDLVSDNSPRGSMIGLLYSFSDKLSAGIAFGYQDFYQKYPRAIYPINKTQDISAVLTNSIQTTPVLLKAKYFPLESSYLKPYISIGAGANVIQFDQYLGEFSSGKTNVGFRAQGGLGLLIPFSKFSSSGINLGANYDYAPYNKLGYSDLNTINFQAGITLNLR